MPTTNYQASQTFCRKLPFQQQEAKNAFKSSLNPKAWIFFFCYRNKPTYFIGKNIFGAAILLWLIKIFFELVIRFKFQGLEPLLLLHQPTVPCFQLFQIILRLKMWCIVLLCVNNHSTAGAERIFDGLYVNIRITTIASAWYGSSKLAWKEFHYLTNLTLMWQFGPWMRSPQRDHLLLTTSYHKIRERSENNSDQFCKSGIPPCSF